MGLFKLLLKLALAALITNAAVQLGSAYLGFYRFKDAVDEASLYGGRRTIDELRGRVMELALAYEVPLDQDDVTIRRDESHTYIDGSYVKPVELVPGRSYPWAFHFKSETLSALPLRH
jgi:hypothetical protein